MPQVIIDSEKCERPGADKFNMSMKYYYDEISKSSNNALKSGWYVTAAFQYRVENARRPSLGAMTRQWNYVITVSLNNATFHLF